MSQVEELTKSQICNPNLSQPTTKIKVELLNMKFSAMMGDTNLSGLPTQV
jgi:hypothetical protein